MVMKMADVCVLAAARFLAPLISEKTMKDTLNDEASHRMIEQTITQFLADQIKEQKQNMMIASFHFAPAAALTMTAFQFAYNSVCLEYVDEKTNQIANVIQGQVAKHTGFKIGSYDGRCLWRRLHPVPWKR